MRRYAGVLALALAGVAAVCAFRLLPRGRAAAWAKRVVGYPAWRRRAETHLEDPAFAHLAASQLGYAPNMPKVFSSPRPFQSFRVVREDNGTVAFRGGAPSRTVATDLLGPFPAVWTGDFSSLTTPGRYRIELDDGLASFPFDIRPDVLDSAVRAVERAFYFQRAFTAVEPRYARGPWVHGSDAALAPPGVVKGWHDAGDLSVYSATMASTLFWLLESYSDFAPPADDLGIPESGNGVPDLLDEARWGLEWMLSVQDASGGFQNATCESAYGPYGTNRPEAMAPYSAGEVGTLATARAVGTLAYASQAFRAHDARFAQRCLQAAERGYAYLAAHAGEDTDGPTCPAYRLDGNAVVGHDVRMYAAAGMLLATGGERYRQDFEAHFLGLGNDDASAARVNWYGALLYLRAPAGSASRKAAIRQQLRFHADAVLRDGDAHPFQWGSRYAWGSIASSFQRTGVFNAKACLESPSRYPRDCEQALANVHYALGRNSLGICYVSGLPGVSHGHLHAFHHWLAALQAEPYLFPGLVAGGPNRTPEPADTSYPHKRPVPVWGYWGDPALPRDGATPVDGRYTDNDSWCTNEIDIEWQAISLYAFHFGQWWAHRGR